jgi:hypothetical protein
MGCKKWVPRIQGSPCWQLQEHPSGTWSPIPEGRLFFHLKIHR